MAGDDTYEDGVLEHARSHQRVLGAFRNREAQGAEGVVGDRGGCCDHTEVGGRHGCQLNNLTADHEQYVGETKAAHDREVEVLQKRIVELKFSTLGLRDTTKLQGGELERNRTLL